MKAVARVAVSSTLILYAACSTAQPSRKPHLFWNPQVKKASHPKDFPKGARLEGSEVQEVQHLP